MAVVKIPKATTLSIKVQSGVSATGAAVYKTLRFGSVKPAASDADIFAVGLALGNLQAYPIAALIREDNADLMNQE